jgi:hypothetical protein
MWQACEDFALSNDKLEVTGFQILLVQNMRTKVDRIRHDVRRVYASGYVLARSRQILR